MTEEIRDDLNILPRLSKRQMMFLLLLFLIFVIVMDFSDTSVFISPTLHMISIFFCQPRLRLLIVTMQP